MKPFYILLGLVFFSLACVSFYFTNIKQPDNQFVKEEPLQETIYIYREYGDVAFKNKDVAEFTSVGDTKMALTNHATVKTGNGRGYVIFPDNSSISISTSTEIEITYTPAKISILQLFGTTYHRVTSLISGNAYEVRTPNTLAAVRGTKFAVTYSQKFKRTYVAVTEHKVEITPTNENGIANKAPVIVQEGSIAEIQSSTSTTKTGTTTPSISEKMIIRNTDEVKEIKNFIEENKIIDKEFDTVSPENRKEFLEKIISILQNQAQSSGQRPVTTTSPTETRATILTRAVRQLTTKQIIEPVAPSSVVKEPATIKIDPTIIKQAPSTPITPAVTAPNIIQELPLNVEEFTPEQEVFIDSFYTTYEKYFFVDDAGAYCRRLGATQAKDMMMALLVITNKAGFKLPNQTEISLFANDLVTACSNGTMAGKASEFKARFDVVYPY